MNIQEITPKVESAIDSVKNGLASQYIKFYDKDDNQWTVRVSDHTANPTRCDNYTISLVVDVDKSEDSRVYTKNFRNIANVHYLNSEGNFFENFEDVEMMLEYYLD